jgi:hypothetical protein
MKKKYLIWVFAFIVVFIIYANPIFITIKSLPDFNMIDDFNITKEFSSTQKNQIQEIIEGKTFTKYMNIYANYGLNEDRFIYVSLYINDLKDNPILVKNNFIFKKKSYDTTRIIVSKTGLLGGSKIRLDGNYYKLSNDDERRLLEILE